MSASIDKDELIIALLQDNARMPVSEIARKMNVSRTAAKARLEKLERTDVIKGYTLRLSGHFHKNRVRAIVMVKSPAAKRAKIETDLAKIPQLSSLYSISGIFDLAAQISALSVEDLDRIIDHIGSIDGVTETQSSIILSTKQER